MEEIKSIFKFSDYDKFRCIANNCNFTCCDGWDINIDLTTYNKWKKEPKCKDLLDKVKIKRNKRNRQYFINKETYEPCMFLDDTGLCNIIKNKGEEYLSLTCKVFPRIKNKFGDMTEYSLSCSCPEVVEIIMNLNNQLDMEGEKTLTLKNKLEEIKIRDILISIIREKSFKMEYKLIVAFHLLLNILENKPNENYIKYYYDKKYIKEITNMYKQIDLNIYDSFEEINNLFLDITENYKEVNTLKESLKDISKLAENIHIESMVTKWNDYKISFEAYDDLIENIIVAKIFSNCVSRDMEEMVISFQNIILEYILIRYSVFLKCNVNNSMKVDINDIKNYVVVFSRVISNNREAVSEFFKEGFGDSILEIGYICFIELF